MEVKTVKIKKSDIKLKNSPKSAMIWNQTVLAITKARSDIFKNLKTQQQPLALGYLMGFEIFLFCQNLEAWWPFERGYPKIKSLLLLLVFRCSHLRPGMEFCQTFKR